MWTVTEKYRGVQIVSNLKYRMIGDSLSSKKPNHKQMAISGNNY